MNSICFKPNTQPGRKYARAGPSDQEPAMARHQMGAFGMGQGWLHTQLDALTCSAFVCEAVWLSFGGRQCRGTCIGPCSGGLLGSQNSDQEEHVFCFPWPCQSQSNLLSLIMQPQWLIQSKHPGPWLHRQNRVLPSWEMWFPLCKLACKARSPQSMKDQPVRPGCQTIKVACCVADFYGTGTM